MPHDPSNDARTIEPGGPVRGSIRPPGSKSLTNRALVCAALARGPSSLSGVLDSEDTRVMAGALEQLGIGLQWDTSSRTLHVDGGGGDWPCRSAEFDLANSGTSVRFLTAMLAAGRGNYLIDGVERMRERPLGDLIRALNSVGGKVRSVRGNDCPPITIEAGGLTGGEAVVGGHVSSQFLSGLLLAAPYAQKPMTIRVDGELVSRPYVEMTIAVMRSFGGVVDQEDSNVFRVAAPRCYEGRSYPIEPDASAASYFWAAAAVTGGRVTVEGLCENALQGDVDFCRCLQKMGCELVGDENTMTVVGRPLKGIEVDMNAISDTVPTLAVVSLFADGATTIRGVAHVRHKESDRIGDLARELRRVGAHVDELPDGLRLVPGRMLPAAVRTYNDHRMAMSFAIAGLATPGITILDPGCTAKTYPDFFQDLDDLCRPREADPESPGT